MRSKAAVIMFGAAKKGGGGMRGMILNLFFWVVFCLVSAPSPGLAQVFTLVEDISPVPIGGAREPSLFALTDGSILMGWTEPTESGFAVRTAILADDVWSAPHDVVVSDALFVNWADFASVSAFGDGTLVAHWLVETGPSAYAYDINISISDDRGQTWGPVIVPHDDDLPREHGFVSLLPLGTDEMLAVWLDGRAYDSSATGEAKTAFGNAMQVRTATLRPDGELRDEAILDLRSCTCCQTAVTATANGTVIVAYRDRAADEIRDIALSRRVGDIWSDPTVVHPDGWEISGCPVNGPALDSAGQNVVLAWYTEGGGRPEVKVSLSSDAGETFGTPVRVDLGDPIGHVDVLQQSDGTALVAWIEWVDGGETMFICRVGPDEACDDRQALTRHKGYGSMNFPRMVTVQGGVVFAWTQPVAELDGGLERASVIRVIRARR
ncbi:MAG: sialidase family protein [Jannaschia sp.]